MGYYYLNQSRVTREYEYDVRKFFTTIEEEDIKQIIIDLRQNSGGNSDVINAFLNHIPVNSFKSFRSITQFSPDASIQGGYSRTSGQEVNMAAELSTLSKSPVFHGDIYVLTGHGTYSSGNMFAVQMHDASLATIEGEPTGNAPSSFGDILFLRCPIRNLI